MSTLISPRVLKGFRDFLPADEEPRKRLQRSLEDTFSSFGFVPIDTPVLEYTEVLLGKGGGETDKQVYRFRDHGDRDVALRFDLTVPFARYMAAHLNELYLPFKRYHIAKVWRGENTQKGRYREFTQCDFDIVGVDSAEADFEILLMMQTSLKTLGVDDFTIRLSHRGVFNQFLEKRGIRDESEKVLRAVDKLAKVGAEKVREMLREFATPETAEAILDFIQPEESFGATLEKMERLSGGKSEGSRRLAQIRELLEATGLSAHFRLDPSITRGLDYYTGLVYETFLNDQARIGSVCSGGRYNNLASLYTKQELPGVGSSIGLDRLLAALEERQEREAAATGTKVLIINMDEALKGHYFKLSRELRQQGVACEIYPETRKLKHQFAFAEKKGIPGALFCGSDEYAAGTVTLKNLTTRESREGVARQAAAETIRDFIG